ncbi:hypothetical protein BGZ47_011560 [Haplosporangium gracile]|nr:hypothetical protein BGZ47_011560 [Haplosporangium gracile]
MDSQLIILELHDEYIKLAAQGVDLHEHRMATLKAIHDSLDNKSSKIYRSIRGAVVSVIPLGDAVAEKILIDMGLGIITGAITVSVIPGASSIHVARSAPKIMDQILEAVHKHADELHMTVIQHIKAMPPSRAPSNNGF